jgi:flavin-binding protein dodecin
MPIAKSIEISADSESSFSDAIQEGVKSACEKLDDVQSVWVKDQQAKVANGSITLYRVWLKVTFKVK